MNKKNARDFISQFTTENEESEFEMTLGGERMTVRLVTSIAEIERIHRQAVKHYERCKTRPLPDWKPFLPITDTGARMAYWLQQVAVDPPFTIAESLEFAKKCSPALIAWYTAYLEKTTVQASIAEKEAIDEEGEDSAKTDSTGLSVLSDETILAENTPI